MVVCARARALRASPQASLSSQCFISRPASRPAAFHFPEPSHDRDPQFEAGSPVVRRLGSVQARCPRGAARFVPATTGPVDQMEATGHGDGAKHGQADMHSSHRQLSRCAARRKAAFTGGRAGSSWERSMSQRKDLLHARH